MFVHEDVFRFFEPEFEVSDGHIVHDVVIKIDLWERKEDAHKEIPDLSPMGNAWWAYRGYDDQIIMIAEGCVSANGLNICRSKTRLVREFNTKIITIECKPSVGDDYPAILRKLKRACHYSSHVVLLIGSVGYIGEGATKNQMVEMFRRDKIRVIFVDEIDNATPTV
jgi:hypothetical protein